MDAQYPEKYSNSDVLFGCTAFLVGTLVSLSVLALLVRWFLFLAGIGA